MFCSPPGRASAQLGPGRVKILRLAFQVTTASQQKKTPLFVFTSAPPATGQLLSRLITQPLAWLDSFCIRELGATRNSFDGLYCARLLVGHIHRNEENAKVGCINSSSDVPLVRFPMRLRPLDRVTENAAIGQILTALDLEILLDEFPEKSCVDRRGGVRRRKFKVCNLWYWLAFRTEEHLTTFLSEVPVAGHLYGDTTFSIRDASNRAVC